MGYCESSTPLLIRAKLGKLRLKTCGFPHFYFVFCFTAVSSLAVRLYGSRSSADGFSAKSPSSVWRRYFGKTKQKTNMGYCESLLSQFLLGG